MVTATRTEREIIGTGAVADILGCSVRHVCKLADAGRLPCYRLPGSKHRRFRRADIMAVRGDIERALTEARILLQGYKPM